MNLRDYLRENAISQMAFGRKLDPPVTQTLVSQWINGKTRVPLDRALEIHSITDGLVTPAEIAALYRRAARNAPAATPNDATKLGQEVEHA